MKTRTTLMMLTAALLAGCGPYAVGSGDVYEEQRGLSGFNDVVVESDLDVEIWVGPSQSATVNADDNLHSLIRTEVRGTQLHVYTDADIVSGTREVRLTVPALYALSGSDGANLTVRGVTGPTLDVELSGGAELEISGGIDQVSLALSGGSELHGRGLSSNSATVRASGGSEVELTVYERLDVDASGGSEVTVHGSPAIVSPHMSGGSELHFE